MQLDANTEMKNRVSCCSLLLNFKARPHQRWSNLDLGST